MAKVKFFRPIDMFNTEVWWGFLDTANGSTIRIVDGSYAGTYSGSFSYGPGGSVSGVLRAYEERDGRSPVLTATDINKNAAKIYKAVQLQGDFDKAAKVGLSGADNIIGSKGADGIRGFAGSDIIKGKGGSDRIEGGGGKDSLYGNAGNDLLDGGNGDDLLKGGGGNDTLIGGKGNDILKGGGGADTFLFDTRKGVDTIQNFQASDRIGVDSSAFGGADASDIYITSSGGVDQIYIGDNLIARATGHDVTESDFFFY